MLRRLAPVAPSTVLALALAIAPPCGAGTEPDLSSAGPSPSPSAQADIDLIDQDGHSVRLYRDLINGKVVVISAFFTSCTQICPLVGQTLAALQNRLGDRLGREVQMLSITLDPETDNPAALKRWARQFKARPGWRFVTGRPEEVRLALRQMGFETPRPESHSGLLLVVNEPRGLWRKISGLDRPERIDQVLEYVLHPPEVPQ